MIFQVRVLYYSGVEERLVRVRVSNQLVSYTREMDLVRVGDQAKFENASLRTKHFSSYSKVFRS